MVEQLVRTLGNFIARSNCNLVGRIAGFCIDCFSFERAGGFPRSTKNYCDRVWCSFIYAASTRFNHEGAAGKTGVVEQPGVPSGVSGGDRPTCCSQPGSQASI